MLAIADDSVSARWNFPAALNTSLSAPGGIGKAVALTYSFLRDAPTYDPQPSFLAFTNAQKTAARSALDSIDDMVRVAFTEDSSGLGQNGDLAFGSNSQPAGNAGYAYYPAFDYSASGGRFTQITANAVGGTVWLNRSTASDSFAPGTDGYATLLHEVGHALGLKHPFAASAAGYVLSAALDTERYTVMSYNAASKSLIYDVSGTASSYSYVVYAARPTTLMPLDITALQYLYGANTSTRTGSDTYRWATNQELLETLWDAGGTDIVDCSNQTLRCVVNLTPGSFSSIALRQTDAEKRSALGLPSWFSVSLSASTYDGSNNLAIASGTWIEKAIGGSAADWLQGNVRDNLLDGRGGADTLTGGAGNDTYVVNNAGDRVEESASAGTDLVQTTVTYTLAANVEQGRVMATGAVKLSGNALGNVLYAGNGNNLLDGAGGIDTVSYAYAPAGVVLSLAKSSAQSTGGSGSDTLQHVEGLSGSGFGDKLSGNGSANSLRGAGGNDSLVGGAGNDLLAGGLGRDILAGGAGQDRFRFDTAPATSGNIDTLRDFSVTDDLIELENAVFPAIGGSGALGGGILRVGAGVSTAADANDHLIYNKTTGALYYDADGAGGDAAVQFAKLAAGLALGKADFLVT